MCSVCAFVRSYVVCLHFDSRLSCFCVFFFQAEDGIRDLVRSRGLGDVYKRQGETDATKPDDSAFLGSKSVVHPFRRVPKYVCFGRCLLYTSDAADERSSVDLGGRRIIKKKNNN